MKKLLITVTSIFLLLSCATNPTEKQKEFADILREKPIVKSVKWGTTLSLWVQVDESALGTNPKVNARTLAEDIAAGGLKHTKNSICVNIYVIPGEKLATACQKHG